MSLPKTMKALRYSEPKKHSVVEVPLPVVRDGDVLIKGIIPHC
jgi:D-arabinitol dehydrogenase (NADP+)